MASNTALTKPRRSIDIRSSDTIACVISGLSLTLAVTSNMVEKLDMNMAKTSLCLKLSCVLKAGSMSSTKIGFVHQSLGVLS
ncbi:hypothetical protein H2199_009000 [Coniosporium tulheliwenetii]|uniref:Uncharacterized protein n=1 Tax=Coniosporium tulheliwenetii TaxID=3383036 RepID=A0ACC2YH42_9PEZI|nr:hypothetical protein H2199_009000 [Cladosporium sp. JES 115]